MHRSAWCCLLGLLRRRRGHARGGRSGGPLAYVSTDEGTRPGGASLWPPRSPPRKLQSSPRRTAAELPPLGKARRRLLAVSGHTRRSGGIHDTVVWKTTSSASTRCKTSPRKAGSTTWLYWTRLNCAPETRHMPRTTRVASHALSPLHCSSALSPSLPKRRQAAKRPVLPPPVRWAVPTVAARAAEDVAKTRIQAPGPPATGGTRDPRGASG